MKLTEMSRDKQTLIAMMAARPGNWSVRTMLETKVDWQAVRELWDGGYLSGNSKSIGHCTSFCLTDLGRRALTESEGGGR